MSENFIPSKPIGKTDEPDSAKVETQQSDVDDSTKSSSDSTCTYQGSSYSEGSRVCMEGKIYRCTDGAWRNQFENC